MLEDSKCFCSYTDDQLLELHKVFERELAHLEDETCEIEGYEIVGGNDYDDTQILGYMHDKLIYSEKKLWCHPLLSTFFCFGVLSSQAINSRNKQKKNKCNWRN